MATLLFVKQHVHKRHQNPALLALRQESLVAKSPSQMPNAEKWSSHRVGKILPQFYFRIYLNLGPEPSLMAAHLVHPACVSGLVATRSIHLLAAPGSDAFMAQLETFLLAAKGLSCQFSYNPGTTSRRPFLSSVDHLPDTLLNTQPCEVTSHDTWNKSPQSGT